MNFSRLAIFNLVLVALSLSYRLFAAPYNPSHAVTNVKFPSINPCIYQPEDCPPPEPVDTPEPTDAPEPTEQPEPTEPAEPTDNPPQSPSEEDGENNPPPGSVNPPITATIPAAGGCALIRN